ncbi:kinase-like protein [Lindgomyces ingoldianus]|uniref:Kinase-like protein n=1 Tax=Lindgomyces ingoldianus TaxID=673940 RepID=A0ACB6RG81_9PLEO|nr:kinase-like protein [Lindgomyces ingoldianus]KAF2478369.1 kinase-like protein [Lindgomyces ingoldianus]
MARTRVKGLLTVYGEPMTWHSKTIGQAANLNEREDKKGQNPGNSHPWRRELFDESVDAGRLLVLMIGSNFNLALSLFSIAPAKRLVAAFFASSPDVPFSGADASKTFSPIAEILASAVAWISRHAVSVPLEPCKCALRIGMEFLSDNNLTEQTDFEYQLSPDVRSHNLEVSDSKQEVQTLSRIVAEVNKCSISSQSDESVGSASNYHISKIPLLLREYDLTAPSSPVFGFVHNIPDLNLQGSSRASEAQSFPSVLYPPAPPSIRLSPYVLIPQRSAPPRPFEQSKASIANASRSAWLEYLNSRGLLDSEFHERDWSGKGQHAEYQVHEIPSIPLVVENVLGHTASALVESVICRNVRLARKTVRCTRRVRREDALKEVEHLQRLEHSHLVRVVGTYIITPRKDLSILLYPVAEYNLETFLDSISEDVDSDDVHQLVLASQKVRSVATFFGCLAQTLAFIHANLIKHMDIKPKNILVRDVSKEPPLTPRHPGSRSAVRYKVYVADFGIARAYTSAEDAETANPTAFTRVYAAPEVVSQDTRGLKADVFSLGCVFAEMVAALLGERDHLADIRDQNEFDSSFQANIPQVRKWVQELPISDAIPIFPDQLFAMLSRNPAHRPPAARLAKFLGSSRCCTSGPEEFIEISEKSGAGTRQEKLPGLQVLDWALWVRVTP